MTKTSFRFAAKRALTLVELLIVMALLILLASISLGAMKSLLRGQKVSQASVVVRQYLQNAQMRAVASGRPVAVFLDRISMANSGTGSTPTAANYSVTRLQFGEVFPPYTGDIDGVSGLLREFDFTDSATAWVKDGSGNFATSRMPFDNHADAVEFALADVLSGFGTGDSDSATNPGFVKPGDLIEFEGFTGKFVIERYKLIGASNVVVQFFNPPSTYSLARSLKSTGARHSIYESSDHSAVTPQLSLSVPGGAPPGYVPTKQVRFRIYRQPTRSMVGSLVLPRGTCIDLSVSGVGLNDNGPDGGTFGLATAPAGLGTPSASDFSRLGLVFNSEGRLAYIIDDNTMRTPSRIALDSSSMVYLMVGRTDQVLPGFPTNSIKMAATQHPDYGASELPKSNLSDPENVWVTCNPFTGEVKTSPNGAVDLSAKWAAVQANATTPVFDVVSQARSLAAAGMTN